jgi:hypothetical protein
MLKKIGLPFIILLVFNTCLLFGNESSKSQVSEAKVKAALIINFAQNIQWPNESLISTYLIGLVDRDSSVYKELLAVKKSQKIKGKPFDVAFVDQQTFNSPFNILYFSENAEKALTNIFGEINLDGVLIITDRGKDRVLTMINIL